MFVRQNKCRAVNRRDNAQPASQSLREAGLAGAEIAFETKHVAGAREFAEARAKPLHLRDAVANDVESVFVGYGWHIIFRSLLLYSD